jgi:hypothetical protein
VKVRARVVLLLSGDLVEVGDRLRRSAAVCFVG